MARNKPLKNRPDFKTVKTLIEGESIRFKDSRGKFTKFDARKKLVAEIYIGGKKSRYPTRTLNKISKNKPVPQKFDSKRMKKRLLFQKVTRKGRKQIAEVKDLTVKIDARLPIFENLEIKADSMLKDMSRATKRGNATFVTIEFEIVDEGYHAINMVIALSNKGAIALDLARAIIARLYRNKKRMSNIQISPIGRRGKYVRSLTVKFSYQESKRLKTYKG